MDFCEARIDESFIRGFDGAQRLEYLHNAQVFVSKKNFLHPTPHICLHTGRKSTGEPLKASSSRAPTLETGDSGEGALTFSAPNSTHALPE